MLQKSDIMVLFQQGVLNYFIDNQSLLSREINWTIIRALLWKSYIKNCSFFYLLHKQKWAQPFLSWQSALACLIVKINSKPYLRCVEEKLNVLVWALVVLCPHAAKEVEIQHATLKNGAYPCRQPTETQNRTEEQCVKRRTCEGVTICSITRNY